jgi:hypothetical protein
MHPRLEQLEDRTLMSNYSAATVSDLIADINAANAAGGTNTITLTAPTTSPYVLTTVNNTTNGATALPVISGGGKKVAADSLTIIGNGDTIERGTASGTPDFRLFDVASGASLTLENLTLQNGLAFGSGSSAEGGAIYNQGTLVLSAVTVQGNVAQGSDGVTKNNGTVSPGNAAAGGGIWSGSSLTLQNGTLVQNNQAIGDYGFLGGQFEGPIPGGDASGGGLYLGGGTANLTGVSINNNLAFAGVEASAYGGGLYLAAGTLNLSSDTVDGNQATAASTGRASANYSNGGGLFVARGTANLSGDAVNGNVVNGAPGAPYPPQNSGSNYGDGGGIYVAAGATVTLCNDTVQNNLAIGVSFSWGGGLYIASKATVYIDSFTVANTINNDADGVPNILGTYILQNC